MIFGYQYPAGAGWRNVSHGLLSVLRLSLGAVCAALVFNLSVLAADSVPAGGWAGTWEMNWRGSTGYVVLEQTGDRVSGRYPLYNSVIAGEIRRDGDGERLVGKWTTGERSGAFIAVLGNDKRTFTGRFDTGEWWTGTRTGHAVLPELPQGGSPREAFANFVIAGNLATNGMGDGWRLAAELVDFAGVTPPLSRAEQLHQVQALFALIDLTTFRYWAIPDPVPGSESVALNLEQARSAAVLALTMRKDDKGAWRIVFPGDNALRVARTALLAAYGGKAPAADAYRQLQSPRDTMRAFLQGMADWNGAGRALALSTLDLSHFPELLREANGEINAHFLRRVLNQIGLVGLQGIPNDGGSREPYVHFAHGDGNIVIAPSGPAADAPWKFTAETVARIRDLYLATAQLPPPRATPPGLIPDSTFFTLRDHFAKSAPFMLGRVNKIEYWQAFCALAAIAVAFMLARLGAALVCAGLRRIPGESEVPRWFYWSLVILATLLAVSHVPRVLGLATGLREYTMPYWGVVACIAAGLVGWHLLDKLSDVLAHLASRTATPTDDILVTLLIGGARLVLVIASSFGAAHFLSLPTSNVLAGLGIGGLALAFASRETLSNVFGAGILVADRPFRRGDWIKSGDIEGAVESVGVRSTRVRTEQDSIVFVPNGRLADSTINNLGTRRHRLLRVPLTITGGATPEKLEAFVDTVRERIAGDQIFIADLTDVTVAAISQSSVTLEITTCVDVNSDREHNAVRHALLLDLARLAESSGLVLGGAFARADS